MTSMKANFKFCSPLVRAVLAVVMHLWVFASPVHAAVTFLAGATSAASGGAQNSLPINKPAGTSAGDLMLAQIVLRNSTAVTITPPGSPSCGWNQIGAQQASGDLRVALYYCVATSAEPAAYTWNLSQNVRVGGGIAVFRGVDTSVPINANGAQPGSGSAISAPSVTTTLNNAALVAFFGAANGTTSISAPVPPMQSVMGVTDGAGPNGCGVVSPSPTLDTGFQPGKSFIYQLTATALQSTGGGGGGDLSVFRTLQ